MAGDLTFHMGKYPAVLPADRRYARNHMWCREAGGRLHALFPGYAESGRSPQFTLTGKHWGLPDLPFFGLGNHTSEGDRTHFGLRATEVASGLDVPLPFGFTLAGEIAGSWFAPEISAAFGAVNNETTAPGLHSDTAYLRPRALVT